MKCARLIGARPAPCVFYLAPAATRGVATRMSAKSVSGLARSSGAPELCSVMVVMPVEIRARGTGPTEKLVIAGPNSQAKPARGTGIRSH